MLTVRVLGSAFPPARRSQGALHVDRRARARMVGQSSVLPVVGGPEGVLYGGPGRQYLDALQRINARARRVLAGKQHASGPNNPGE